jgi:hypothetical protein
LGWLGVDEGGGGWIRAAAGGSRPVCLAGVRRDERKGKEKISVSRDIHHFMSCIFSE